MLLNKYFLRDKRRRGFTIVELLIVIAVIAILAAVVIVGYNGVQSSARDKSLLSDIGKVEAEMVRYATKNGGVYDSSLNWNSSAGSNPSIDFTPSADNVIVVETASDGYCIRIYNPKSSYKSTTQALNRGELCGWLDIVAINSNAYCGLFGVSGKPYCWGQGGPVLGNGTATSMNTPTAVINTGVLSGQVLRRLESNMPYHVCTLSIARSAFCWGRGTSGELGNNTTTSSSVPVGVSTTGSLNGKDINSLRSGYDAFVCALASDSLVYCWGSGASGKLGNGLTANASTPGPINMTGSLASKSIKKLEVGVTGACVIASDDNAYCWGGDGGSVMLGNGTTGSSSTPVAVNTSGALSGKSIKALSMSNNGLVYPTVCAIASDDNAYCWGAGTSGQLGNGTTANSSVPVAVDTSGALAGKKIKSLETGADGLVCVIASDDKGYCWGNGANGQLGNGTTANSSVPVAVDTSGALAGKKIKSLETGADGLVCVIASDDKGYCWGNIGGIAGRLGDGGTGSSVPVAVSTSGELSGKSLKKIIVSAASVCAIADGGDAYCWGSNYVGQLGNGGQAGTLPRRVIMPTS